MDRSKEFKDKADQILKKWFYFGGNRYEDAAELYSKALNMFKLKKDFNSAIECALKEIDCLKKISYDVEDKISRKYADVAKMYVNLNTNDGHRKSITFLSKSVENYVKNGNIRNLGKLYEEIAGSYEFLNDTKSQIDFLKKAVDIYEGDGKGSLKIKNCCEKLFSIYVSLSEFENAAYEQEKVLKNLDQHILKYSCNKLLYRFLICVIAKYIKTSTEHVSQKIEEICLEYSGFGASLEFECINKIVDAVNNSSRKDLESCLRYYDSVFRLTEDEICILAYIKTNISSAQIDLT